MNNEKIKITKQKPIWLWKCNLFQVNGCKLYCTQYMKGTPWYKCKHRNILCKIIEEGLDEV